MEEKKQGKAEAEVKSEDEEDESAEEEYDEEEEAEEEIEEKDQSHLIINQNDMLKSTSPDEVPKALGNDSRDQGFTRPKVLILCPFKKDAYEIIEMIVMLTNNGSWKQVSKRKKFKLDYCNEVDSYDDHFYIGMSLKHNMKLGKAKLKLYEKFYESDIIVGSPLAIRILTG